MLEKKDEIKIEPILTSGELLDLGKDHQQLPTSKTMRPDNLEPVMGKQFTEIGEQRVKVHRIMFMHTYL